MDDYKPLPLDREKFFDAVRDAFYRRQGFKQIQITGLTFLLDRLEVDVRFADERRAAYVLATVKHECADTYQPIVERGPRSYFHRYDGRKDLGNGPSDGFLMRGRGFCMITGRRNYTLFSAKLGIDLVGNPDLALDRNVAYQIMATGMDEGLFTGKKLGDYIHDDVCDFRNARRVINGTDRAADIAEYARIFLQAWRAA